MMNRAYEQREKLDIAEVRVALSDALNQASARLALEPGAAELQSLVARLGQLMAGLSIIDPEQLPSAGAGYGSVVVVQNMRSGEREEFTLMAGPLVDIDAGQVSLASPIGRALVGCEPGNEIVFATPLTPRRLRVIAVTTLMESMSDALYI